MPKQCDMSAPQVRTIRAIRDSGQSFIKRVHGQYVVKVKGDEHVILKRTINALEFRGIVKSMADGDYWVEPDALKEWLAQTNNVHITA